MTTAKAAVSGGRAPVHTRSTWNFLKLAELSEVTRTQTASFDLLNKKQGNGKLEN